MNNPTPQDENPKMLSAMTDRELLAVFVRTLRGCDWLSVIQDSVDDEHSPGLCSWEDNDYLLLLVEYYLLSDAVDEAAARAEGDAE